MAPNPAFIGFLVGILFGFLGLIPALAFYLKEKAKRIPQAYGNFIIFPAIFFAIGFFIGILGAPK